MPTTEIVSLDNATNEQFKAFAMSLVTLEGNAIDTWDPWDRCEFINYLIQHGVQVTWVEHEDNVRRTENNVRDNLPGGISSLHAGDEKHTPDEKEVSV